MVPTQHGLSALPAGKLAVIDGTKRKVARQTMAVITFDPGRLLRDEGVPDMLGDARVRAPREYPRPGGLGRLQQSFAQAPVEKECFE